MARRRPSSVRSRARCSPTRRRTATTSPSATAARPPAPPPASPTASSTTGRAPTSSCRRSAPRPVRAASGSTRSRTSWCSRSSSGCWTPASRCRTSASAVDALRARGVDDLAQITLLSDGTTVYECTSSEEVVDLLRGGQGVFGIAVSGALRELRRLARAPAGRAGRRRRADDAGRRAERRAGPAPPAAQRRRLIVRDAPAQPSTPAPTGTVDGG